MRKSSKTGKKTAVFRSALHPKTPILASCRGKDGKVNAPLLLDCPVSIECSVVRSVLTASHEMFIGKVEHVHADADLVDADGKIDWSRIELLKV